MDILKYIIDLIMMDTFQPTPAGALSAVPGG